MEPGSSFPGLGYPSACLGQLSWHSPTDRDFLGPWFHAKASLNDSLLGYLGNPSSIWLLCSFHSAAWLLFWDWVCHEHPFPALLRGSHTPAQSHPNCPRAPSPNCQESKVTAKKGRKRFSSHLSTPTLLTSELCPMVDSLAHLNLFQASASCFSDLSAEITVQLSVSLTAKH